jgi:hypothetical protein
MTWSQFLERVEFKFPIPTEIRIDENRRRGFEEVRLEFRIAVPDINTGETIYVMHQDFPPPIEHLLKSGFGPARYIRNQILKVLAHEVDECLRIDGVKAHDPHTMEVPRYL